MNSQLFPAIVQNVENGAVLMLGYMNQDCLKITESSGWVTFFSRSRQQVWIKGETSGNRLRWVKSVWDCDQDALLIQAIPHGPTCHFGKSSCFDDESK